MSRTAENSSNDAKVGQIAAPDEAFFRESFDGITPPTSYYETPLGRTAYYQIKGTSPTTEYVSILHGVCTPAVGMYNLSHELIKARPSASILLFDFWGHGLTSTPDTPHTLSIFIDQLYRLLNHLKISKIHLAGYSLGGSVATAFTAAHPELVQSLTLLGTAGLIRFNQLSEEIQAAAIPTHPKHPDEATMKKRIFADFLEGGPDLVIPPDWHDLINRGIVVSSKLQVWEIHNHKGHEKSVISIMQSDCPFDADEYFVKAVETKVPIIAIMGDKDDVIDEERLNKVGIHNCKMIPGADHAFVRNHDVIPVIVKHWASFLQELDK